MSITVNIYSSLLHFAFAKLDVLLGTKNKMCLTFSWLVNELVEQILLACSSCVFWRLIQKLIRSWPVSPFSTYLSLIIFYSCLCLLQEGQVLECSLINSIRVGAVPKVRPWERQFPHFCFHRIHTLSPVHWDFYAHRDFLVKWHVSHTHISHGSCHVFYQCSDWSRTPSWVLTD